MYVCVIMPVKLFTFSPPSCVLCPVTWPVIVEIEGSCLGLWDINDEGFLKSKLYQGLPMNGSISTTTQKIISKNFSFEKIGLAYVVCGCNFFSQTQWSIVCEIRWCSGDLNSHTWNRPIVSPRYPKLLWSQLPNQLLLRRCYGESDRSFCLWPKFTK